MKRRFLAVCCALALVLGAVPAAGALEGEARHLLLHAVEAFDTANDYLARAVAELKK